MDFMTPLWLSALGAAGGMAAAILTIGWLRLRNRLPVPPRNGPGHKAPALIGRDTWGAAAQAEMNYLAGIEPDDDLPPSLPPHQAPPVQQHHKRQASSSDAASDAPAEPGLIIQPEDATTRQRPEEDAGRYLPHLPPVGPAMPADLQTIARPYYLLALKARWSQEGRAAHE